MTSKFIVNEPTKVWPQIYVYEDKKDLGWLKVGYTTRKNAEDRIREQFNTRLQRDSSPYIYHHVEDAIDRDGKAFTDKEVHKVLISQGIEANGEFFRADLESVKSAILSVKLRQKQIENRTQTFGMRIEQQRAVELTQDYFRKQLGDNAKSKPKFLWNAKMRFGKTFTSYQLARVMGFTKVLVVTYKPAVEDSWREDLNSHMDFLGWQFISRKEGNLADLDKSKPFVYFASFQDLLGKGEDGSTKKHNEWLADVEWDIVIQDEYHYGAWRDSARELVDSEDLVDLEEEGYGEENVSKSINARSYLYLSGTPFRVIESGEFTEEQIFNWTYADEQRMKAKVAKEDPGNKMYSTLPEMTILTYQLPEKLKQVANKGDYNEFSLSHFFKAKGEYDKAEFIHEPQVQEWLDLIRGKMDTEQDIVEGLKRKVEKTLVDYPFTKNTNMYKSLNHMIWLLPDVASTYAMAHLLRNDYNKFYHQFEIVIAAGKEAGSGVDALIPLKKKMKDPLKTKTITLSCGKLTTGVTVAPWTGIFMLRTLNSPESYFQSAFRVQSSWTIDSESKPGEKVNLKEKSYVFDFDPNRALSQIVTHATKLDNRNVSQEEKVAEFIKFLPILAHDGFTMEKIDAVGLLDMTISSTTSSLLAKGWNSNLLLNLDSSTIKNMVSDENVMNIVNSIQSHRSKKTKVDKTIINNISSIKTLNTKKNSESSKNTDKEINKQISAEQREFKKKRQLIEEKLKTLITRLPLFMYLTDFREEKLTDIILNLEPELFTKVTRVTIEDFKTLLDIGLFNDEMINDAVYRFRRFEDASLEYTGISRDCEAENLCIECNKPKSYSLENVRNNYIHANNKKVSLAKNDESPYCYMCKANLFITI